MIEQEQEMSEKESLALITEMIGQARNHFNENGTSAILWGAVVSLCGFLNFAESFWHFDMGFDIWLLALIAIIPQVFISIRERRQNGVKTHTQSAVDVVWTVYAISIFALIFYLNIVPGNTDRLMLQNDGVKLLKQHIANGTIEPQPVFIPSFSSLMLIIYAFPTICTGLIRQFRPMIVGAFICYTLFVASLFTTTTYDYLFMGLAGIFNWLIPGIILRKRYMRAKHV